MSVARFYPEGTIISGGLSKWCGAGGWRLGTFAFPKSLHWLKDAMAVVASETYTSTSAPIQYAATRAFNGGLKIKRYLSHIRRILRALGGLLTNMLQEAGISVLKPKGAFYLFPDFGPLKDKLNARGIETSDDLCQRLLEETGVAILPGSAFGCPPEELTARLSYVDIDGARALAAAEQIPLDKPLNKTFLQTYCQKCITAADLIGKWANREK